MSLAGAAAVLAFSLSAGAQQRALPVIGMLNTSPIDFKLPQIAGFRQGIAETGLIEGQTVSIEYRSAQNQVSRLPALAAELVRLGVSVIAATGSSAPGLAAKAATSNVPIVFQTGGDPVQDGLVPSLNRPGGNVTGVSRMSVALGPKRLELLHALVPAAATVGFLVNPANPTSPTQLREIEEPARSLGIAVVPLKASNEEELNTVFATAAQKRIGALLVANDPSFNSWAGQLALLSARHAIPGFFASSDIVNAGGLISYAASLADSYRQVGVYAGRIVKGEKPSDLPVLLPTKFELVINLKTARVLGIAIPEKLLSLADGVIE